MSQNLARWPALRIIWVHKDGACTAERKTRYFIHGPFKIPLMYTFMNIYQHVSSYPLNNPASSHTMPCSHSRNFDAASTTKPIGTLTCDGSPWMWKSQGKGHGLPRKTILKCWVFMGFRHLQWVYPCLPQPIDQKQKVIEWADRTVACL